MFPFSFLLSLRRRPDRRRRPRCGCRRHDDDDVTDVAAVTRVVAMVARRRCARQWRCWTRTALDCVTSPSRSGRWWSRRMDRARRPCDTATSAAPVSFSVRTDGLLMCSRQLRPVQIRQCKCPRVFTQSTTSSRADPSVQMPACLHTVDNFVPCRSVSANARVSSYSRQLRPVQIHPSVQMPACLHTVDNFVPCRSIHQCKCPRVFIQSTTSSRADPSVQMPACLHTVDNFVPCRSVSANDRVSSHSRQLRPVQIRQCK